MKYRREQDRHDYLKKQEQEAVILSLDALGEELLLIDLLYSQTKSERETASILGISQNAVNKKKHKLLGRLKKDI